MRSGYRQHRLDAHKGGECNCPQYAHLQPTYLSGKPAQQERPLHWWNSLLLPVMVVGLLLFAGFAWMAVERGNPDLNTKVVTVCSADKAWLDPNPNAYEFETTEGDFIIRHPDGELVKQGRVYTFTWLDGQSLASFNEVKDATPAPCE